MIRPSMTRESLLQIIAQIDNDPLAGMGHISKKDLLVDRLLAHWNTVTPRETTMSAPRPLLNEVNGPSASDVLEMRSQKIASK